MANRPFATSPTFAYRLAAAAGVLGFPVLLADAVRRAHPLTPNQIVRLSANCADLAPGLKDNEARTARYSSLLDLTEGPVMVILGDLAGREYNILATDAWGCAIGGVSALTRPDARLYFACVGPDWRGELSAGGVAVRARSNNVWIVSRLSRQRAGADSDEEPAAPRLRRVTETGAEAIEPGCGALAQPEVNGLERVRDLDFDDYFFRLAALMDKYPANPDQARLGQLLRQLTTIRLAAATSGDAAAVESAVEDGHAAALEMIQRAAQNGGPGPANQWLRAGVSNLGHRARGLERVAQAWNGFGAPEAADLVQFFCSSDSRGAPLNGAERYVINFPADQLPMAKAFWELSFSDRHELASRRPTIASDRAPAISHDGSLQVLIQRDEPNAAMEVNWLPPPEGGFSLAMRLHWPGRDTLEGAWWMPPVERLSSVWPRARRLSEPGRGRSGADGALQRFAHSNLPQQPDGV